MELYLTGGVFFTLLCDIKKAPLSRRELKQKKTDPSSEFEMMLGLWEIVRGHCFTLNKDSLRTKLTQYKNCEKNGDSLIPLETRFNEEGASDNANYYLFNKKATKMRIAVFINTFIDTENQKAIEDFVNTVNEIIEADGLIYEHGSDSELVSYIYNEEETTMSLDDYLYNVILLVINSHPDNIIGKETLAYINQKDYSPKTSKIKIEINTYSKELINQYAQELEEPKNAREGWDKYINVLKEEFSKVKIYYDPDREYQFSKIYVPSSISLNDPYYMFYDEEDEKRIDSPTSKKLAIFSRYTFISGVGGLGKTMLLRHLLLEAIENDTEHVPIFVSVRNYTDDYEDFIDFIYAQCSQYCSDLTKDKLLQTITSQQCLLFLDGFDEIPFEHLQSFIRLYNKFIRIDFGNTILMSSRPVGGPIPNHFSKMYILPFNHEQSCQLVDILTGLQHNTSLGERFKNELHTSLFKTHKEYAGNPLLLTLMLRIYEQNASIPKAKFDFYYNAYEVLSHKHDALKEDGGFSRSYKTGLNPTDFANCFKEFCTYSMLVDGLTSFYESEMLKYFDMIKIKKEQGWNFELSDFIYDATTSTGLMYYQGNKYNFVHRSMQEFFCAWFLSTQEDSVLYNVALQLQNHGRGLAGETIELLDERIHYKMEKYVYLPYFNSIFMENGSLNNNYFNFLIRFYDDIHYHHSTGAITFWSEVQPNEALYSFCMKGKRKTIPDTGLGFPEHEEFEGETIVDYYENDGEVMTAGESNVPCDYDTDKFGAPEIVGHYYSFEMSKVLSNPNEYKEIVEIILSDDFPLKKEYEDAKKYWTELQSKFTGAEDATNIINLLH